MKSRPTATIAALALTAGLGAAAGAGGETPATSCVACHGNADWFDEEGLAIVEALDLDVHGEVDLSCHDCHGGNPDPALAEDLDAAMDPDWADNPYLGVPARGEIPGFCGACHSDPRIMRRYRPDARVDQEREYWTSQHGEALAAGSERAATCVDCHGVHGIRRSADPESPVYDARVAETCRGCHESAETMAGVQLPNGQPLPLDQYARWRRSVHAAALIEREDLFAPTCNDCHGNHGAAPPGLASISFVCGQCHGREAELFRQSTKRIRFELHNEFLEGGGTCADCHEPPEPAAAVELVTFSECASCHGNHGIVRPTVALLSPLPETPCAFCHEAPEGLAAAVPEPERSERRYLETRDLLLGEAAAKGLDGNARFDWLVDRAARLPSHRAAGGGEGDEVPLRPEFERLFDKFRIGKTTYEYADPETGAAVTVPIAGCTHCHAAEPLLAEEPAGLDVAARLLRRMWELTSQTARAERILLAALRGGVETRDARLEMDRAIDAQISLEVLVHTFEVGEESAFEQQADEGLEHARAALAAGRESLDELAARRRGLAVSLGVILLLLVGLGLKIRRLPT